MKMYADRKGWAVDSITAELGRASVPAGTLGFTDQAAIVSKGQATLITIALDVTGELDHTQRDRLLEIAELCPIHRTLVGPKRVDIKYLSR